MTRPNTKDDKFQRYSFILILIYITSINLFVLKTTPELIALQFLFLVIVYQRFRFREFARTWVVFMALFFLYEFLRGFADDFSPFYDSTLFIVHNLEERIFIVLPSKSLQQAIRPNSAFVNLLLFFYSVFFYYSFFVGFLIWLKKRELFSEYVKKFMFMSFVSLVFFFLLPTAPPWFVNEHFNLELERILYQDSILRGFTSISVWAYFIEGNSVAAFPSLHVAWPAFTTFFILRYINRGWWKYLLLVIPVLIGFSVVYTAEHYVIDVIAGFTLAIFFVFFPITKYLDTVVAMCAKFLRNFSGRNSI